MSLKSRLFSQKVSLLFIKRTIQCSIIVQMYHMLQFATSSYITGLIVHSLQISSGTKDLEFKLSSPMGSQAIMGGLVLLAFSIFAQVSFITAYRDCTEHTPDELNCQIMTSSSSVRCKLLAISTNSCYSCIVLLLIVLLNEY
jgi:hypothetical protein